MEWRADFCVLKRQQVLGRDPGLRRLDTARRSQSVQTTFYRLVQSTRPDVTELLHKFIEGSTEIVFATVTRE